MTKLDPTATCVTVTRSGVLCVDGIKVLRIVWQDDKPWLQFCDRNRERCEVRGTNCVEIPLDTMLSKIVKLCERRA